MMSGYKRRRTVDVSQSQSQPMSEGSSEWTKVGTKWKRVTKSKRIAKLPAPVKAAIRYEIKREVEVKSRQTYYGQTGLYGPASATVNATNNLVVCPSGTACDVVQGTGEGARIGNQIRTRRLIHRGILIPNPYNATDNPDPGPLEVRMVYYRQRNDPSQLPGTPFSDFFQFNSTTNAVPDSLSAQIEVINTDKYQVFTQRYFKVGYALSGPTNVSVSGTGMPGVAQANNDFKLNSKFRVDLTKYLPKVVRYNDNNADPTSAGIYCLIIVSRADGTAIGNAAIPLDICHTLDFQYEDA